MVRKSGARIGYARVSTSDQDMSSQLDALKRAGCRQIFQDVASGAKSTRQGLDNALAYLRPGDTLVVWKIDRLGRSLAHLVALMQNLSERKIGFRSITDAAMDTTSPGGALIFHIFAALAGFERELIRERTRAGLAAAKARGRRGGRKPVVTPEVLTRAHALQKRGLTVRETAAALKIGKTALYEALAAAQPKARRTATAKGQAHKGRTVRGAKR
jgi:DNA invertase Pin-like site-specific DNA recombinase